MPSSETMATKWIRYFFSHFGSWDYLINGDYYIEIEDDYAASDRDSAKSFCPK